MDGTRISDFGGIKCFQPPVSRDGREYDKAPESNEKGTVL